MTGTRERLIREVATLRSETLPQHIGMVVAGKLLAAEIKQIASEWIQALAKEPPSEAHLETATSDLLDAMAEHLVSEVDKRGLQWARESYRLEGKAAALEQLLAEEFSLEPTHVRQSDESN